MEESSAMHLKNLYGLNPNIPHIALQFPRLPPGLFNSMFKIYENPLKENLAQDDARINQKLQGFQQSYQKYASGLLTMSSSGIVPPGHPLFDQQSSIGTLKSQNDKLLKENLELRKKLDEQNKSSSKTH